MFRFTIRDVSWLMVVAGLSVALWIQHRKTAAASLQRKNWEQSARSVAHTSSFSVKFHDDGTCTFYPREYDLSKARHNTQP